MEKLTLSEKERKMLDDIVKVPNFTSIDEQLRYRKYFEQAIKANVRRTNEVSKRTSKSKGR